MCIHVFPVDLKYIYKKIIYNMYINIYIYLYIYVYVYECMYTQTNIDPRSGLHLLPSCWLSLHARPSSCMTRRRQRRAIYGSEEQTKLGSGYQIHGVMGFGRGAPFSVESIAGAGGNPLIGCDAESIIWRGGQTWPGRSPWSVGGVMRSVSPPLGPGPPSTGHRLPSQRSSVLLLPWFPSTQSDPKSLPLPADFPMNNRYLCTTNSGLMVLVNGVGRGGADLKSAGVVWVKAGSHREDCKRLDA